LQSKKYFCIVIIHNIVEASVVAKITVMYRVITTVHIKLQHLLLNFTNFYMV